MCDFVGPADVSDAELCGVHSVDVSELAALGDRLAANSPPLTEGGVAAALGGQTAVAAPSGATADIQELLDGEHFRVSDAVAAEKVVESAAERRRRLDRERKQRKRAETSAGAITWHLHLSLEHLAAGWPFCCAGNLTGSVASVSVCEADALCGRRAADGVCAGRDAPDPRRAPRRAVERQPRVAEQQTLEGLLQGRASKRTVRERRPAGPWWVVEGDGASPGCATGCREPL